MACRDLQAATLLALLCGLASAAGLLGAALLPAWRAQRLYSSNRNDRNVSVWDGLWSRCVRFEGRAGCALTDPAWYRTLDRLDLRLLQLALPPALLLALCASALCGLGMCHSACSSKVPSLELVRCLVNSAGCHLVSGALYLLSAALALAPSLWLLLHTARMNLRHATASWSPGPSLYLALGSSAGLLLSSALLLLWYCACRSRPAPFWQPLASCPESSARAPGPGPGLRPAIYGPQSRLSTLEIDIPVLPQQLR